ncbi:MAG: glutamine synthetase [Actinobacteria bacterium]|nr:glutamine synthetase [Actinomycetota bacterium]
MTATAGLEGVTWVRLSFVDVRGVSNSVIVPSDRFDTVLRHGQPFDGSALEGRVRTLESDMLVRPVPSTLVRIAPGIARVVCTIHRPDGTRWSADSRQALESAPEHFSLPERMTVSAELEWYLLDGSGNPVDNAGYFDESESTGGVVVRGVADQLLASGIPVDACHHEAGPGQYEIDIGALPPLELADALVLAKQVIRERASDAGLRATFMARPFAELPGSGLHVHQHGNGELLDDDGNLTAEGSCFVAGQLAHAQGLCALAAPTVNSYKRLHSGPEAPAVVVWAHANRAALMRVSSYRGADASIEYRGADPSTNPYLLLAGLFAAAADGLDRKLPLPSPTEEAVGGFDPVISEVRFAPLPRSLDEALDALVSDDVLLDAFDGELLNRFVDARRAEAEDFRAYVTGWERDHYLDEA